MEFILRTALCFKRRQRNTTLRPASGEGCPQTPAPKIRRIIQYLNGLHVGNGCYAYCRSEFNSMTPGLEQLFRHPSKETHLSHCPNNKWLSNVNVMRPSMTGWGARNTIMGWLQNSLKDTLHLYRQSVIQGVPHAVMASALGRWKCPCGTLILTLSEGQFPCENEIHVVPFHLSVTKMIQYPNI